MKVKERRMWQLFLAGLIVIFGLCTWHVFRVSFRGGGTDDHRKIVRISHYMLHSGLRDALQAVIDEYELLHPEIHLVQVPVPERAYLQFLRTQLVAGSAPDIMQLGAHLTGMDELRTRYFLPITKWVDEPNPYNAGTSLDGRRWRDTFLDGLDNTEAYSSVDQQFYSVPLTVPGVRIFYNVEMLRQITGSETMPQSYQELIALCQQVEDYARRKAVGISPFAGSRMSALFLMSPLFSSVNQKLYYDLAVDHSLSVSSWDYGLAYLQGHWSFDTPSVRLAYRLTRELARYQKPGFYQLQSTDATMQFLQGQSLMLTALVLDASNLVGQASFPISAAPIPALRTDDPVYGTGVLGPVSELSSKTTSNLGIVRKSRHADVALDFLRFLTSKTEMAMFSKRSSWQPSVVDVEVSDWMKQLQPVQEGYAGRFLAEFPGKGDARFVVGNQFHLLFGHGGGVDEYLSVIKKSFGPAIMIDLVKDNRELLRNLKQQDPGLLLNYLNSMEDDSARDEFWRDMSGQNEFESRMLQRRLILARAASSATLSQTQ